MTNQTENLPCADLSNAEVGDVLHRPTPHETIKRAIDALKSGLMCCNMLIKDGGATSTELSEHELPIIEKAITDLRALLDVQMVSAEEWIPIDQYDYVNFPEVELAAYIIPSGAMQANRGTKPFWDFGFGRCWHVNTKKFTGICGGSPSHFRYMRSRKPPIAATLAGKIEV